MAVNHRYRGSSSSRGQHRRTRDGRHPKEEDWVVLDSYDCDLNLTLEPCGYIATPLTKAGFALLWAGIRASHGVKSGRVCFEVKIMDNLDVSHLSEEENNPHVLRVGFSCENTELQLGEEPLSFGFGVTGKTSTDSQFSNYGVPFGRGDVVISFLDFREHRVEISFAVNGRHLGAAFLIEKRMLNGRALFPHVLTRNCRFQVNFGHRRSAYFPPPPGYETFVFVSRIPRRELERGTRGPRTIQECQMIMMCGLPGSGKTTWAQNCCKKNPNMKFNILGTDSLMDRMKVSGLNRKANYRKRWEVLFQLANKCLDVLVEIAARKPRNYILDQTNVYESAQLRKSINFEGFRRTAVVVVPSEEFCTRIWKQKESGKCIPEDALLTMKGTLLFYSSANFVLPEMNQCFEDILYTDLQYKNAEILVSKYNREGKQFLHSQRFSGKGSDVTQGDALHGSGSNRNFRGASNQHVHFNKEIPANMHAGGRHLPEIFDSLSLQVQSDTEKKYRADSTGSGRGRTTGSVPKVYETEQGSFIKSGFNGRSRGGQCMKKFYSEECLIPNRGGTRERRPRNTNLSSRNPERRNTSWNI